MLCINKVFVILVIMGAIAATSTASSDTYDECALVQDLVDAGASGTCKITDQQFDLVTNQKIFAKASPPQCAPWATSLPFAQLLVLPWDDREMYCHPK